MISYEQLFLREAIILASKCTSWGKKEGGTAVLGLIYVPQVQAQSDRHEPTCVCLHLISMTIGGLSTHLRHAADCSYLWEGKGKFPFCFILIFLQLLNFFCIEYILP